MIEWNRVEQLKERRAACGNKQVVIGKKTNMQTKNQKQYWKRSVGGTQKPLLLHKSGQQILR